MKTRSKRYKSRLDAIEAGKDYGLKEAVGTLKQLPEAKFDETVELHFQLGLNPEQPDQMLRSSVILPNGTGKKVRVLCFCKGEEVKDAQAKGAEHVGGEELVAKIQEGWLDFDVVIAHPDMMRDISKLGRVLGPKGLMPSPKAGTVTKEVGKAVEEVKKGKIEMRSDKTGGVHVACGKLSFDEKDLIENIRTAVRAIMDNKPKGAKGEYIKNICLSTTQGPGLSLNINSVF